MKNLKMKNTKEDLKKEAIEIRNTKNTIKKLMRECKHAHVYQYDIIDMKRQWRHKHIAYCILKGRKIEEIEKDNSKVGAPIRELIEIYTRRIQDEN